MGFSFRSPGFSRFCYRLLRDLSEYRPIFPLRVVIAGVALGIVIVFALAYNTTNTTSPSMSAKNSSAENMTVPGASLTPDFLSYENSTYAVKMQYPNNWTVQGGNTSDTLTDVATFLSPTDSDGYYAAITIYTDDISGRSLTLSKYLDESINLYKTFAGFKFIASNTDKILAGYPAYGLQISYQDPIEGSQRVRELGAIKGDQVYSIAYIANTTIFSSYLPTAQNMINSFEISK
jgi:hypothetical protein